MVPTPFLLGEVPTGFPRLEAIVTIEVGSTSQLLVATAPVLLVRGPAVIRVLNAICAVEEVVMSTRGPAPYFLF